MSARRRRIKSIKQLILFKHIYDILSVASSFYVIWPIITGIRLRTKIRDKLFRLILLYLSVSLTTEIIGFSMTSYRIENTLLYDLFSVVEFGLVMLFFLNMRLFSKSEKMLIVAGTIICYCSTILSLHDRWIGWFAGTSGCMIVAASIAAFIKILERDERTNRFNLPGDGIFWLVCSIFVYFSSAFFAFLFDALEQDSGIDGKIIWTVPLILNIVFYTMINKTLWLLEPASASS
jgi:hypothetical protein